MLLGSALVLWVILCLSGSGTRPLGTPAPDVPQSAYDPLLAKAALTPLSYPEDRARWSDAADTSYSDSFKASFTYDDAEVTIDYLRVSHRFIGVLQARGLKPNFAYQIKLRGDYGRDALSHERIGFLGRWRLHRDATNFTDSEYRRETYCQRSEAESYLFFDWFLTDEEGNARHAFSLTSSLHVLWNSKINYWDTFEAYSRKVSFEQKSPVYGEPGTVEAFTIGAENEGASRNRPAVGKACLPQGHYRCQVVLTEESFHTWDGYWATVLGGDVDFYIVQETD